MNLRYLALGDSYTIGESVSPAERFPVQLTARLRETGLAIDDPVIVARTGWTTGELWDALEAQEPLGPFDLVTLLIGVNDQYRGHAAEAYHPLFSRMLARAIGYAGNHPSHVIVVSIPDWGVTPFAARRYNVGPEIDQFNALNYQETLAQGAHYVNITPLSRAALYDAELLADDGLHPSGKMYRQWVELLLPIAQAAISANG